MGMGMLGIVFNSFVLSGGKSLGNYILPLYMLLPSPPGGGPDLPNSPYGTIRTDSVRWQAIS